MDSMSDQLISQVGSATQSESARYTQAGGAAAPPVEANTQEVLEQGKAVQAAEKNAESDAEQQTEVQDEASLSQKTVTDVFLKFQIDEENDLTIYVLDKTSKEVIRTIPPEEIAHMSAGELVELFI
jgi:uncharacterized FlaG/YvyC family protein